MAEGAYSAKTLRAQKAGGAIFQAFCESRGEPYLPASSKDDPSVYRGSCKGRQEARNDKTLRGNGLARAYGCRSPESPL